ncbi:50S ribosomal protein L25/general stress protein Ctc [Anaplasma capra]|uniref:50S ribosomal protein L25/general stress protein Ctc n=1 Tax=Anaplasma capra TaxID=1562740 RepID=UPI0021D56B5C|nr:50S ribosomal protein L25/general stress protein Ctc [Anaplasma capra]MCU7611220.1 50S ribosomal protein L25/general stress protein Ctc [Anaplasma capra]MCU7612276.1 50S ribosomal protein L25/general stress protein Ctc [Anaplasma capra]
MGHGDMIVVEASVRAKCGTGSARALRAAGSIPAVVYGKDRTPVHIALSYSDFLKKCRTLPVFSQLIRLSIDGKEEYVLTKEIQKHPVSGAIAHVDFQFVDKGTEIKVEVPLVFLNEQKCAGVKLGGALNILHRSLLIRCAPDAIPQSLEVDLLDLGIGHSIHVSDLKLHGSTQVVMKEENPVIASVSSTATEAEPAEEDGAAGESTQQGGASGAENKDTNKQS